MSGLVVGMDRLDDLREGNALPPERRIEPEGLGEGLVDGEPVGDDVPEPGADDGAGAERELDALDVLPPRPPR